MSRKLKIHFYAPPVRIEYRWTTPTFWAFGGRRIPPLNIPPGKIHLGKFHLGKFHLCKIPPIDNSTFGKFHPRKIPYGRIFLGETYRSRGIHRAAYVFLVYMFVWLTTYDRTQLSEWLVGREGSDIEDLPPPIGHSQSFVWSYVVNQMNM